MNWHNVKLILQREVRDQLRDRRTMFMIFVLPLLIYPFLGMTSLQVAQFVREHATSVLILGRGELPDDQRLIDEDRFRDELFSDARQARLLELHFPEEPTDADAASVSDDERLAALEQEARRAVREREYEVVLLFPPGYGERLQEYLEQGDEDEPASAAPLAPTIFHNSAKEKSQIAFARVYQVLNHWRDQIFDRKVHTVFEMAGLEAQRVDRDAGLPIESVDVANPALRDAAVWSKIFPFLLLIWALTGAFYPAVDLCAGEKERGTLETLLSSPAERGEIVVGKLLTVMLFSMATVVLNVLSMAVTGKFILSQLPQFGPPHWLSLAWLVVALVPVSALFSALCLALAAFARSSKEGQYYLMPLLLVTMPLAVMPMAPAVELTLGNSLIPITGIVLVLRTLMEGDIWRALPFIPPVVVVTLACCLLAIRWAVEQFNSETVLFREGERVQLNLWLRHLLRDREATPSPSEAIFCGVLILMIRFFMGFALPQPESFRDFIDLALISQLVVIATPALLMTIMLTRSPRQTLLLNLPSWTMVPAAALLALAMHPVVMWFQTSVVQRLYPISDEVAQMMQQMLSTEDSFWQLLVVVAIVPAVCEELAFRGFILSGLRHVGHKWRAIVVSSLFFGMAHSLFQQSLVASLVGAVIGYLAVQSGSLLPGIVYHMLHNGLALATSRVNDELVAAHPWLGLLYGQVADDAYLFRWQVVALGSVVAMGVFYWLHRQPYRRSPEERLQEAIDHHASHSLVG